MTKLTRRQFLKLSGTVAAGTALAGCAPQLASPTPAPTATAVPPTPPSRAQATATPVPPTAVPTATATQVPVAVAGVRPEIIQFYPAAPSRVVQTHHAGVWQSKQLAPAALRQMLDASITKLTGLTDTKQAWAALFSPQEKIAIKVNAFRNSTIWTHAALVRAVTDSLQDAGVPAGQITVFDFMSSELTRAGYTVNTGGAGVQCHGADGDFDSGDWQPEGTPVRLSRYLTEADALINIPVLKSHMIAAMTFALKNHFGTVDNPDGLHYQIDQKIAALNALPPIKDKTRLVIGDVLEANLKYGYGWPYWEPDFTGDSILMSYDPVAVDVTGARLLGEYKKDPELAKRATAGFVPAANLGLGTADPAHMDFVEVKLT